MGAARHAVKLTHFTTNSSPWLPVCFGITHTEDTSDQTFRHYRNSGKISGHALWHPSWTISDKFQHCHQYRMSQVRSVPGSQWPGTVSHFVEQNSSKPPRYRSILTWLAESQEGPPARKTLVGCIRNPIFAGERYPERNLYQYPRGLVERLASAPSKIENFVFRVWASDKPTPVP